ncbi:hypothetical protein N0V84_010971 [Fusarium piperis]|uniref:Uncharacterized protein n=1 Tax=Fusarium piperis TaxID=1435070 RepID=A0A9W8TD25_9HYPO|nr:hypothetical protein N0V84_010971 [Fusarium piperis]
MATPLAINIQNTPGLFDAPTTADLRESSATYNELPHIETQSNIPQQHLTALLTILSRYGLEKVFGFHLIHRHDEIGGDMVRIEASLKSEPGTWTKPVPIDHANLANIHGSLFMLQRDGRLVAYEYREGQPEPFLSADNPPFFQELAEYILKNDLARLIALEVLDRRHLHHDSWAEYELEGGSTVVLAKPRTNRGNFARATGWTHNPDKALVDGDPQPGTHYENTTKGTHRVFVSKSSLQDEKGLMDALRAMDILKA